MEQMEQQDNYKDKQLCVSASIMRSKEISQKSKLVYAYLCSRYVEARKGDISRKQICEELGIGQDTLGKCLNQLEEFNVITRRQDTSKSDKRYSNNKYFIRSDNINLSEPNPIPTNKVTVNEDISIPCSKITDSKNIPIHSSKVTDSQKIPVSDIEVLDNQNITIPCEDVTDTDNVTGSDNQDVDANHISIPNNKVTDNKNAPAPINLF